MANRSVALVLVILLIASGVFEGCRPSFSAASFPTLGVPQIATGLSFDFYSRVCPDVFEIVKNWISFYVAQEPGEAAGILRLLFHDCFVQGCDASVLLEGPYTEQSALPNSNTLRNSSLQMLEAIKADLEAQCPMTVSCSDILALAAREAIYQFGGPWIPVALGRRDGTVAANNQTVMRNIPAPTSSILNLKQLFSSKGLDIRDLVALSGAHSIGQAHCLNIDPQISTPSASLNLERSYALSLKAVCLPQEPNMLKTVQLDLTTPNIFDNSYFKQLLSMKVPFHSDAALLDDEQAKQLVVGYAENQDVFFEQFRLSMAKLSQIGVKTGSEGEIRRVCKLPNAYYRGFSP